MTLAASTSIGVTKNADKLCGNISHRHSNVKRFFRCAEFHTLSAMQSLLVRTSRLCHLFLAAGLVAGCASVDDGRVRDGDIVYLNASAGVPYAGSRACASCHREIYDLYMASEMGRSMSLATTAPAIEHDSSEVRDTLLNYAYRQVRRPDGIFQQEIRRNAAGTIVHLREVRADYIVGSGNNLRMYFHEENGMFFELPLTWYVHRGTFDLSPGYRDFGNLRFRRYAEPRCIGCHNAYMTPDASAHDRYVAPYPLGIGCERCHGPGTLHIQEKLGELAGTPDGNERTIVNPRRLSPRRQIDVCQQCHLQGKSWSLVDGKTAFDFRPGMLLESVFSVYAEATSHKEVFEVADSPHRLKLSKCFRESGGALTCITCHNPHRSITTFSHGEYNAKCLACHSTERLSPSSGGVDHRDGADCLTCHMNRTGSDNTLHGVSNTDHWIRRDANQTVINWATLRAPPSEKPLIALVPDVDRGGDAWTVRKGLAYAHYYRQMDDRMAYRDSSLRYLEESVRQGVVTTRGLIAMGELSAKEGDQTRAMEALQEALRREPDDPEGHFQMGKLSAGLGLIPDAIAHFSRAVGLKPGEARYLEGLAEVLAQTDSVEAAAVWYGKSLDIDPANPATYNNLGLLYAQRFGEIDTAVMLFGRAAALDPDLPLVHLNLGNALALAGRPNEALGEYRRQLDIDPRSSEALVNMGNVLLQEGRQAEARGVLLQALQINPDLDLPMHMRTLLGLR